MALTWPQTRDVITVGSAVLMAFVAIIFGTSLPRLWQQAEDIGAIKSEVSAVLREVSSPASSYESLDAKATNIDRRGERIEQRIANMETDPSRLLVAVGMPNEKFFTAVTIGDGSTYVFPRTEQAQQMLMQAGFTLEEVSPGIAGFKMVSTTGAASVEWFKRLQEQGIQPDSGASPSTSAPAP